MFFYRQLRMKPPLFTPFFRRLLWVCLILTSPTTVNAQFRITEFLADNQTGLTDEEGHVSDWIEILNTTAEKQNLAGWSVTDDITHKENWIFPDLTVEPGEYLVVFASGNDRRISGRPLHPQFKLKAGGDYLALLNPVDELVDEFKPRFPKQRSDISYGQPNNKLPNKARDYLAYPTPGRENAEAFVGKLTSIDFSVPHGLFESPFTLKIATHDADVTVRYTIDGSTPDENSDVFKEALAIDKTTVLRARGFKKGYTPTPVVTASYIFPRDRLDDSADGLPPEGYPYEWGNGKANYGLDEMITSNPKLREQFVKALYALPSYSLVTEVDGLFSDERGIYAHAGWHGRRAERDCSLELLPIAGLEPGFQIGAGVRMRGGSSRAPRYQKHGFRFFFRKQYGRGKLKYDLFHGAGATEFDHIDLRCTQQYSWHHGYSQNALYVRDQFGRQTQLDLGQPGARGNFAHLYINGHYWGMYNTCERPEASFGESYLGGDKEDYDVLKTRTGWSEDEDRQRGLFATDGLMENWTRLYELTKNDLSDSENYAKIIGVTPDGSKDPNAQTLLDPVSLIDYMLTIFYVGHLDAPISWFGNNRGPNNWYGLMNRKRDDGFRFIIWDAEQALLRNGEDRLGPFPGGARFGESNPQWIYQRGLDNEEFRILLTDRVAKHLFRDGALTPGVSTARFDRLIDEIRVGLFGEAARWGNPRKTFHWALDDSANGPTPEEFRENGIVKYQNWLKETERFKREYLTQRTQVVINQLMVRGLYPDLPEIEAHWNPDHTLALRAGDAPIVYTTHAHDPRLFGGQLNEDAQRYDGPLRVPAGTTVTCRIYNGEEWGPLREFRRPTTANGAD
jgi:hypothetical protein